MTRTLSLYCKQTYLIVLLSFCNSITIVHQAMHFFKILHSKQTYFCTQNSFAYFLRKGLTLTLSLQIFPHLKIFPLKHKKQQIEDLSML